MHIRDQNKTKAALLAELSELRAQLAGRVVEQYRSVFALTLIPMFLFDRDGTILLANHQFRALAGSPVHDADSKVAWFTLTVPEDLEEAKSFHDSIFSGMKDTAHQHNFTFPDAAGRKRRVNMAVQPVDGAVSVASLEDLSALERDSLTNTVPIPVIDLDLEGNILYFNAAVFVLFMDLPIRRVSHPVLAGINEILATFRSGAVYHHVREVVVDGLYYEQFIYCLDSKVARVYTFDITERRTAEIALSENLNFLQRLIDAIPNPVSYKGKDGRYLICNKAFEEALGLTRDMIIRKTAHELFEKTVADEDATRDSALLEKPGKFTYESRFPYNDGQIHDVIVNKATYVDMNGDVAGIVAVFQDIQRQKQIEQQLLWLASFPNLDPNPVIEINLDGRITYVNPAAHVHFSDLASLGSVHPIFLHLPEAVEHFRSGATGSFVRKVSVGTSVYEQMMHYVEPAAIRMYMLNISEKESVEKALHDSQEK